MIAKLAPEFAASDLLTVKGLRHLDSFWQTGTSAWFEGEAQCRLHYRYWLTAEATAALVIVPGRIEAAHKYLEVCADAVAAGYQVFVLDHRGQGASERLTSDRQIGLVLDFNDYISDLGVWFSQIRQLTQLPLIAMAHSMGGAILAGYLQQATPVHPIAAIFCSPMWGLPTAPMSHSFAQWLALRISQLNKSVSRNFWYGPGQRPYQEKPFLDNDLTTCPERYQWFRQLYQQYPEYQVGGASWTWLACALQACEQLFQGKTPEIPMLLVQAEQERVVDNAAQNKLWQQWQLGSPIVIAKAQHELLCGEDWQRQLLYTAINQFLATLPALTAEQKLL